MCRLVALMLAGLCFANAAQAQDIPLETAPSRGERLLWSQVRSVAPVALLQAPSR